MNDEFFTDNDEVAMGEQRESNKRHGRRAKGRNISQFPAEWDRFDEIGKELGAITDADKLRMITSTYRHPATKDQREEPAQ